MSTLALPKACEHATSHTDQQSRRDIISKFAKKHRAIQENKSAKKSVIHEITHNHQSEKQETPTDAYNDDRMVEDASLSETLPKENANAPENANAIDSEHFKPARDKISKFAQQRRTLQDNKPQKQSPPKQSNNPKSAHAHDDDFMGDDGSMPKTLPKALSMILAMAWHDVYLKEAFMENPVDVARLLGVDLPEGVILKAEDIRGNCCITVMEFSHEMGIHRRGMSLKLDLVAEV